MSEISENLNLAVKEIERDLDFGMGGEVEGEERSIYIGGWVHALS